MTTLQAVGSLIMLWGMFIEVRCVKYTVPVVTTRNSTVYLNIVTDHVHSFMSIMFPYVDGHNASFRCARLILNWCEKH